MHGGICGAEASTILKNSVFGPNAVICNLCINMEQKKSGKFLLPI